jgi:uncharacterized protein (DUF4415 family)
MSTIRKIKGTDEAWESGELGRDPEFAVRAPQELEKQVDDALGMQAISIRLEKELIESFKLIAKVEGMGYQPLMREALRRFAQSEFKRIAIKSMNEQIQAQKENPDSPPEAKKVA